MLKINLQGPISRLGVETSSYREYNGDLYGVASIIVTIFRPKPFVCRQYLVREKN